jgi:acetolactate decarboxylase
MKTTVRIGLCLCILTMSACRPEKPATPSIDRDQITQISVINALMLGQYDGVLPVREMLRYGDFGVGTLDHLDGELIVLDGKAYQVRGDGVVKEVDAERTTPFAVVTPFQPDGDFPCPKVGSLTELEAHLDTALQHRNHFQAIRVDGRFSSILLRSVHRQEPPYKPLAEVAKSQSVWTHQDVGGTLVGIRSPSWVTGLTVPGYHWHFLSDDRRVGGHVLDCKIREGQVRHAVRHSWLIKLGDSAEFNGANLGEDLSHDLERVESSRGHSTKVDAKGR